MQQEWSFPHASSSSKEPFFHGLEIDLSIQFRFKTALPQEAWESEFRLGTGHRLAVRGTDSGESLLPTQTSVASTVSPASSGLGEHLKRLAQSLVPLQGPSVSSVGGIINETTPVPAEVLVAGDKWK